MPIYGEMGQITKLLHPVIGLGQYRKYKDSLLNSSIDKQVLLQSSIDTQTDSVGQDEITTRCKAIDSLHSQNPGKKATFKRSD